MLLDRGSVMKLKLGAEQKLHSLFKLRFVPQTHQSQLEEHKNLKADA